MTPPQGFPISFVVTTLGRVESLERLLLSLAPQMGPDDQLIIVAQAHMPDVEALVESRRNLFPRDIILGESARGASRGRNVGVAMAEADRDRLLMFPNDTSHFPDGAVETIRQAMGTAAAGAVTVRTASGDRFSLPSPSAPLDSRSVWRVIEMGLIVRLSVFANAGGFDEQLGTGAVTPWQAGEVTDLLMRMLRSDPGLERSFVWIPAERAYVGGIEETRGLTGTERRRKLRAYGRGVGRVFSIHPFPVWHRVRFLVAGLVIGILRRDEYALGDGFAAFTGRLEGLSGRVVGGPRTAVTR